MNAAPAQARRYLVSCPEAFQEAVEALAARRGQPLGTLVAAVLALVPEPLVEAFPDPGQSDQYELSLRRHPGLRITLAPGLDEGLIRRALAVALALERGEFAPSSAAGEAPRGGMPLRLTRTGNPALDETIERLRTLVSVLGFVPLPDGVRSRAEALHVLGFPPDANPDRETIRAKFRMLATIHHPDGEYGSHLRMAQLNAAIALLSQSRQANPSK